MFAAGQVWEVTQGFPTNLGHSCRADWVHSPVQLLHYLAAFFSVSVSEMSSFPNISLGEHCDNTAAVLVYCMILYAVCKKHNTGTQWFVKELIPSRT